MMNYLDTNVILYAIENHPTYGAACKRILLDIERGKLVCGASSLVLLETIGALRKMNNILRRKGKKGLALQANVDAILSLPIVWFGMDVFVVEKIADLSYPVQTADYIHAVTMEVHGMKEILSADKNFDVIPGIVRLDPLKY